MTTASRHRLSRAEFGDLRRAKRISGTYFSLTTALLPGDTAKFSCVVSAKVARSAVERNRIKRVCREAVQKRIKAVSAPLALAFYAKREASEATHADIARDIEKLMMRIT